MLMRSSRGAGVARRRAREGRALLPPLGRSSDVLAHAHARTRIKLLMTVLKAPSHVMALEVGVNLVEFPAPCFDQSERPRSFVIYGLAPLALQ